MNLERSPGQIFRASFTFALATTRAYTSEEMERRSIKSVGQVCMLRTKVSRSTIAIGCAAVMLPSSTDRAKSSHSPLSRTQSGTDM